jgi:hypothetical protein
VNITNEFCVSPIVVPGGATELLILGMSFVYLQCDAWRCHNLERNVEIRNEFCISPL